MPDIVQIVSNRNNLFKHIRLPCTQIQIQVPSCNVLVPGTMIIWDDMLILLNCNTLVKFYFFVYKLLTSLFSYVVGYKSFSDYVNHGDERKEVEASVIGVHS